MDIFAKISPEMTVPEAREMFLEWSRIRHSPLSVRAYDFHLRRFAGMFRDRKVGEIRLADVTAHYIDLKRAGYASASLSHLMTTLRQFLKFLFLQRAIDWDYQLVPVPKCVSVSYRPVETADALEMIRRVGSEAGRGARLYDFGVARDRAIISMLFASGVRNSELMSLNLSDLRLKDRFAVMPSKKNGIKRRMVFWDEGTHKLLMDYLWQREFVAKCDALFVAFDRNNSGMRLRTRTVQRIVAAVRPSDWIKPHGFRHGLGMRAVQSNLHPEHIRRILGHKHLASSEHYLNVNDPDLARAYRRMSKKWRPQGAEAAPERETAN